MVYGVYIAYCIRYAQSHFARKIANHSEEETGMKRTKRRTQKKYKIKIKTNNKPAEIDWLLQPAFCRKREWVFFYFIYSFHFCLFCCCFSWNFSPVMWRWCMRIQWLLLLLFVFKIKSDESLFYDWRHSAQKTLNGLNEQRREKIRWRRTIILMIKKKWNQK